MAGDTQLGFGGKMVDVTYWESSYACLLGWFRGRENVSKS